MTARPQDREALALGRRLRQQAPGGRLLSSTQMLTPLDWFVVRPGRHHDLSALLSAAKTRQPRGLVFDAENAASVADWFERQPQPEWSPDMESVEGLARRSGWIASGFHGEPSMALEVVGITGTNGKSSVVHGLAEGLARLGRRTASIGTLGVFSFKGAADPTLPVDRHGLQGPGLTSLDPVELHEVLARLRDQGVQWVFLEASSIGLEQGRLEGCRLVAAGITNLSHEHLDVHGTMPAYASAKALLPACFGVQVVVAMERLRLAQDQSSQILARAVDASPKPIWVGTTESSQAPQRIVCEAITQAGQYCRWRIGKTEVGFILPTWGHHNLENAGLIGGLLLELGISLQEAVLVLSGLDLPQGRLEQVRSEDDQPRPMVLIDYAHTPDALSMVLSALRPVAQSRAGRLVVVFGCGGDRDRSKRPLMGRSAAEAADLVILTADNSRSESTATIIEDIRSGIAPDQQHRIRIQEDRHEAIHMAIESARAQDVVVLCGKGHEKTQLLGDQCLPFDESLIAGAARRAWRAPWTLRDLLPILDRAGLSGARWLTPPTDPTQVVMGVSIDSRRCPAGSLFAAILGERFDGHDFLPEAANQGAVAALVCRHGTDQPTDQSMGLPLLMVPDTIAALGALAAAWRADWPGRLVAVTGSNGKTTVKEMIASIMRAAVGRRSQWATPGNLNNQIGLPLSLLGLRSRHRLAVMEIGMNHPGEVLSLALMAKPDLAVVTNAQREHQEFMGTVQACAHENGSVFESLGGQGVVIYPRDPLHESIWASQAAGRSACRFGLATDACAAQEPSVVAEVLAHPTDLAPVSLSLERRSGDGDCQTLHGIRLAGFGEHLARNAAAAAAVGVALGLRDSEVTDGLAAFEVVAGRGRVMSLPDGGQLIDDSYNANPDSVRAAMLALSATAGPVAMALGDMGEVGEQGPAFHDEVLRYAAELGLNQLFLLGDAMRSAGQRAGIPLCEDGFEAWSASIQDWLRTEQSKGHRPTLWLKGSRFMRMERLIEPLTTKDACDAALSH
ncbi:MAG: UDP-N-acetylmuramyl-tripeptide synthetase [Burkholderiaceae bacterium]|nr:UDP-N-acetylmuramyl-tripeptide synthetase [Burkholderiaceae bacterium]